VYIYQVDSKEIRMRHLPFIVAAAATLLTNASATIPFGTEPWWESDESEYGTGGMFYDIDGDGFLELITGNGNDMDEDQEGVYDNAAGVLETTASWRSDDYGYGAHIDLADVDGDGDLDLAVANLGAFSDVRAEEVYYNLGGYFEATPSWNNVELDNTFAAAFGDYDLDGDPDYATGSGYFNEAPVRIYRNDGGTLSTTATWSTPADYNSNAVEWVDIDDDGDLDLFVGGSDYWSGGSPNPNWLFENVDGSISMTPTWTSDDEGDFNQCDFGDFDDDGDLDLVITNTIGDDYGAGEIKIYRNVGGTLETTPSWVSEYVVNASTVKFGDVDGDGDLDLAAGGWWAPLCVYENDGGSFSTTPGWTYDIGTGLVSEQIIWGDLDNDGTTDVSDDFAGDGSRKLFYLTHQNVHSLTDVSIGGTSLDPDEYCIDLEDGWITLATAPGTGQNLTVEYVYSTDMELAVTNWSPYRGGFIFLNEIESGVTLIAFDAVAVDGGVAVRWDAVEDDNHAGYNLYRSVERERTADRTRLNDDLIVGTPPYVYTDGDVTTGTTYSYWLEDIEVSGRTSTYGPASVTFGATPYAFALAQNYPNPAAGETTVSFSLPEKGYVELVVFDITGRKVDTLIAGELAAGEHKIAYSPALAPGVYLYRLTAGENSAVRKMVVR
jgi:hypothetical protein